ncbi:hypothetical protein LTS16_014773 [Friedmanniomyces endolithicus]|nr:hypothetical protein LTS00_013604 [Friedmanniomyces endolithicus]KAK0279508.1 hypothetical protein LTR35_008697 [Friedmanniomyces endolithicus]KAK1004407.1 hypothetical protein LTR54_007406 [Friedmanniomyces endolithicus]KAK1035196.1 hypothetical protein LTS16_014773 [Friedmanniomyces endolithicus]
MAYSNSPRDHGVDANPDVSRKRARLSRSPSTSDSIPFEALDPEDIGTDLTNAIKIQDDDGIVMSDYDHSIPGWPDQEVEFQLEVFAKCLRTDDLYMPIGDFTAVSSWLADHIKASAHLPREELLDKTTEHEAFFDSLASRAMQFLQRNDIFESSEVAADSELSGCVAAFIEGLVRLCVRSIQLLPDITKEKLARRDSAQLLPSKPGQQQVCGLIYIHLLELLFRMNPSDAKYFRVALRLPWSPLIKACGQIVRDEIDTFKALVATLRYLSQGAREIKGSWLYVDSILRLMRRFDSDTYDTAIDMVNTVNEVVLPAICEKHPRVLPDEFHTTVVRVCGDAIERLAGDRNGGLAAYQAIYECLVKGENDAVLSEEAEVDKVSDLASEGEDDSGAILLRVAWSLQAEKRFICSDIMDIRACGITMLVADLIKLFERYCKHSTDGSKHPVVQYAARFLKQNALTSYMFSADSHATLISHCGDIVSFLAETGAYTYTETDIIWLACTTSVEADFANASFAVLQQLCGHLNSDQLLYAVQKYATAPVVAISSPAAIDLLPVLFRSLHEKLSRLDVVARERFSLAAFSAAFQLAGNLYGAHGTPAVTSLHMAAMNEVSMATGYPLEWRVQIYDRCVPAILQMSQLATISIATLQVFLRAGMSHEEARHVLEKLPVTAVVAEIRRLVETAGDHSPGGVASRDYNIRLRLSFAARLLSYAPSVEMEEVQDDLYDLLFGSFAINNVARHLAWLELATLTVPQHEVAAAKKLMERYLIEFVPLLPTHFATPALVDVMIQWLKTHIRAGMANNHTSEPLELPLWKTLVRIAASSTEAVTANAAVDAVCHLLFIWPQYSASKDSIAAYYVRFVRDFVEGLCKDFSRFDPADTLGQAARFHQAINLLSTVLRKSKELQPSAQLVAPMERITLDSKESDSEALCFSLQLCPPQGAPTTTSVQASKTSSVADLASALPSMTGTSSNRIILGGKLVDLEADASKTLSDIGVESSGVILVRPVYTQDCDLETVLTVSGPVEQEMLAQYDRLDSFLDGPEPVARSAYDFLVNMRPSASARTRICSLEATVAQVFPADNTCRTAYSAHILRTQLTDYARLGVADERFIMHGVRLLTACILDESRPLDINVLLPVTGCLGDFLRGELDLETSRLSADRITERPTQASSTSYFLDASQFTRRMISLIQSAMRLAEGKLATALHQVLLQAARVDESVWRALSQDERFTDLQATLLLADDVSVSDPVMTAVNSFCGEVTTPDDAVDKYWCAILASVPQALRKNYGTTSFYEIATEMLTRNESMHAGEAESRQLIATLLEHLRAHEHTESHECSMADEATAGLLRLLLAAVSILKSFKKPLALVGIATELFERLLFPPTGPPPRPLLHDDTRGLAFDLVKAVCEKPSDYRALSQLADVALSTLPSSSGQRFPGQGEWIRAADTCAGLSNLGMTCYMNSLLQQLFANVAFRKFIFDVPIVDTAKQVLLERVQALFIRMQDDPAPCIDTSQLAATLGVQTDSQEDVHGFYATLLTRLEESMPDRKHKLALIRFFTGKFMSQVRGECGHISAQAEPFTDVSITVKNKASLQESLDEFVQGEPMQGANKYRCHSCDPDDGGRLVNAMKRTCLDETPDNLTFCLKRFTFEAMMGMEGKANDRFDFPAEIDMAHYQRQHLENPDDEIQSDVFDLVGVIVHQGSLEFGHYWSYVRLGNAATPASWVNLEDKHVRTCQGVQEVQNQCCGGLQFPNGMERSDNAYVLFYRRRTQVDLESSLARRICAPPTVAACLPPRVEAPAALTEPDITQSDWRWKIGHLFNAQFSAFMDWLVGTCPSPDASDSATDMLLVYPAAGLVDSLACMAARYMLRLLQTDPENGKKTPAFIQALRMPMMGPVDLAKFDAKFMQEVTGDTAFLTAVWRTVEPRYSVSVSSMLENRLLKMKEDEDPLYLDTLHRVVSAHALQLKNLGAIWEIWQPYFDFVTSILRTGAAETKIVLDSGYLRCIWDVLYIEYTDTEVKKKYLPFAAKTKHDLFDLNPLFGFLCGVLTEHVSIKDPLANDGPYAEVDGTLRLKKHDVLMLTRVQVVDSTIMWLPAFVASKRCPVRPDKEWLDSLPGKLLGLVAERATPSLLRDMERTLVARIRDEQNKLLPLLSMAFHYCRVRDDSIGDILKQFGREMEAWSPVHTPEILLFYAAVGRVSPVSAIEGSQVWIPEFLLSKKAAVRRATIEHIAEHIFADPRPTAADSVARMRMSRALAERFLPYLRNAYQEGQQMYHLADVLAVMKMELRWLSALHREVQQILGNEERKRAANLSPGVVVEYDESRGTLSGLRNTLEELRDWEIGADATGSSYATGRIVDASASPEAEAEDEVGDSSGFSDEEDADGTAIMISRSLRLFRTGFDLNASTFAPLPLRQPPHLSTVRTTFRRSQAQYRRPFHSSPPQRASYGRRQAFNYQTFRTTQTLFRRWAARPTFYYEAGALSAAVGGGYILCLEPVPVSGRYRFRIVPYSSEASQGAQMYQQTMQEFGGKLMGPDSKEHRMVQRVMDRLIPHSGLEGEAWEVHVIDDPMQNAFVIPGGKVFVFRGILDVAQGDDGLAAVLGHEIAHNVAHHAAERMSQALPVMVVLMLLSVLGLDPGFGNMALNLAFTLPGSRKQEEEADYIGLMMMSESCYDPRAAMGLWSRMEQEEKQAPPQFLSTHPSSHNRLGLIQGWMPKAEQKLEASNCGMVTGYANDFRQQVNLPNWR